MLYIIGIFLTFFLAFILLTKMKKSIADKILFGWLCVVLLELILFSIKTSKLYFQFHYLLGFEIPLPLLHGPFLFLYTKALTSGNISFRKIFFHFIPYAITLLVITPFLILEQEQKIYVYQNEGEGYKSITHIILLGIILSGVIYTVLSIRTLIKYKKMIKDHFSHTDKINLEWLLKLIIGLSCIWILVFFANDEIIFASVVAFVFFIGYYGIKQVGIFTNKYPLELISESSNETDTLPVSLKNTKYEKSSLTTNQIKEIHKRMDLLMREEKLYLIPELTLAMVAKELKVHPNTLSQVINTLEEKNFFDYINMLRVNEFKERATQPDNQKYTLLSLAYECGFNSKTSFNRNFKNHTGKSPSEYLKEIKVKFN